MMQERNIFSGVATTALAPFVDGWHELLAWCLVAVVLILVDLKFGIEAASHRGERIRGSRVVRRTINKLVDYLCWISIAWILGGSFGRIFSIPLIPAIVMLGVCVIELSSIVDNYCEIKGIKKKINAFKLFFRLIKHPEFEDCMEDRSNEDKPKGN